MLAHRRLAGLAGVVAVLASCTTRQHEVFTSEMSAAQSGLTTTALGSARFELDGTRVNYTINVMGLASPVLGVHLHAGGSGVSGPRRLNLFLGPTDGVLEGQLVSGSFDAADQLDELPFRDLITAMRTGQVYLNVHTRDVPPGEMRGQVYSDGAVPVAPSITGLAQ